MCIAKARATKRIQTAYRTNNGQHPLLKLASGVVIDLVDFPDAAYGNKLWRIFDDLGAKPPKPPIPTPEGPQRRTQRMITEYFTSE